MNAETLTQLTYTTKHGTVATMNVEKIGARPAPETPPVATLQDVYTPGDLRAAGITMQQVGSQYRWYRLLDGNEPVYGALADALGVAITNARLALQELDTWAAGAVGKDRDWSAEELQDYAAANEVAAAAEPDPEWGASARAAAVSLPAGWRFHALPGGFWYGQGFLTATPESNQPEQIARWIAERKCSEELYRRWVDLGSLMGTPPTDLNFKAALAHAPFEDLKRAQAALPEEGNKQRLQVLAAEIRRRERDHPAPQATPTVSTTPAVQAVHDAYIAAAEAAVATLDALPVVESTTEIRAASGTAPSSDMLHQMRVDNLQAMLDAFRECLSWLGDYEKLTGLYSHRYPLERALQPMIETVERNLTPLTEKDEVPA